MLDVGYPFSRIGFALLGGPVCAKLQGQAVEGQSGRPPGAPRDEQSSNGMASWYL